MVALHASAPPPAHTDALSGLCETLYPTAGSLCRACLRLPAGRVAILMVEHAHHSIVSVHAIQRGHQLTKTSAAVGQVVSSTRRVILYQPLPQVSLSSHASLQHSTTSAFSAQGRDKGRFAR